VQANPGGLSVLSLQEYTMRTVAAVVATGLVVLVGPTGARAGSPGSWMLELTLDGQHIEGAPLAWNPHEVHLLGRDGRLWTFAPEQARDYRKTSDRFRAYSVSELRAELLRELGTGFEVTGTGHYLVAHPRGTRDLWAGRFEELYRSFVHYFSVRGLQLAEPAFPLIGVVCRNQAEFARYAARRGMPAGRGVLGYYSLTSNRIILYDAGGEKADSAGWQQNADVTIHEATHQTAFNTGVHSRYAAPPVWVAEGLATMFEAPGVYNSRSFPRQSDRINRGWLAQFRQLELPRHQPGLPADLVASDELFGRNPAVAYAEAWALTFYLVETDPRKYADYLASTARRPPFAEYTAAERTADFTAVFGSDWRMLEARLLRFMAGLE
jgi:hypothetical protein